MLYQTSKLYKAQVINRPSKICKSPYLADIKVYDDDGNVLEENVMAHSPALGCCGLVSSGAYVMCTKSDSTKNKSKYVIHHVFNEDGFIIGINPMLANHIVRELINQNKIDNPLFQNVVNMKQEYSIEESRFDFHFYTQCNKEVFLEVKNVPLADVVDVTAKERKKMDLTKYNNNEKIAIFPDGYRKNTNVPISERAVKHTNHLQKLYEEDPENRICAILFLIQRTDVTSFKPSSLDKFYQEALYDAHNAGVYVLPICVEWKDNKCYYLKDVPLLENVL
jgi:DNA-binding sugar fermentation-stimulating protein